MARIRCAWSRWLCAPSGLNRLPFPLLHIDTGHNFPETLEFRDRLLAEIGEELLVRRVQDTIDAGRARDEAGPKPSRNLQQTSPCWTPCANWGWTRSWRRPPRRGEGAGQRAVLFAAQRCGRLGSAAATTRVLAAAQRRFAPGRAYAGVSPVQLDRTGCLAIHRPRAAANSPRSIVPTRAVVCAPARASCWPSRPTWRWRRARASRS